MKRSSLSRLGTWLIGVALAGHSAPLQPAAAAGTAPCPTPSAPASKTQGRELQGRVMQGRVMQGRVMQGRVMQGGEPAVATVQQVLVRGQVVQDLKLVGTVLHGTVEGKALSGADFIGATVVQKEPDGSTSSATVTDVRTDPQDKSCEVLVYALTVKTGSGEQSLCEPDPWNQRWAIPVAGSWDTTGAHLDTPGFLFACTSGVLAKCIRWGYRPWKQVNGRSLADYHQACTRMARADYCGDGTSHTEDGTLIDLYDRLNIQTRSPVDLKTPMLFDAAWSPAGAYCIAKERWLKLGELPAVLSCKGRFQLLPGSKPAPGSGGLLGTAGSVVGSLVRTSPVDSRDVCVVTRGDIPPEQVLIDNQSGLNVKLR